MPVKSISVSGLRGILSPLELELHKDGKPVSAIIYGNNGTGKSSITDAWEWVQSGKIDHLARESAGPAAYPHIRAGTKQTYVELSIAGGIGAVRQEFSTAKKPAIVTGDLPALRKTASHPCQIRYSDLSRFVYYTKTELYAVLAQLMGFSKSLDFQKLLAGTVKELATNLKDSQRRLESDKGQMVTLLIGQQPTETAVHDRLSSLYSEHAIAHEKTAAGLAAAHDELTEKVKGDAASKELTDLKVLSSALEALLKESTVTDEIG